MKNRDPLDLSLEDVDPATFTIIRHRLVRVTEEAVTALKRVSGSPITNEAHDLMVSGCLLEDYLALKKLRGGRLWPGYGRIMELIRELPKESLEEKLNRVLTDLVSDHYARIRKV